MTDHDRMAHELYTAARAWKIARQNANEVRLRVEQVRLAQSQANEHERDASERYEAILRQVMS